MNTSLIITLKNEAKTLNNFLESIIDQTEKPQEIIFVDSKSSDSSVEILERFRERYHRRMDIKIYSFSCNRSFGRNFAIKKSKHSYILVTDAGCVLDKNWIKNLKYEMQNGAEVVAGFYYPITNSNFEKCLSVYTCVLEEKFNPKTYLASSRSLAFKKSAWKKTGGYPEYLNTCEDLVFAKRLKDTYVNKYLATKKAFVYWRQKKNIVEAFRLFYDYAVGDGMAGYYRKHTPILIFRVIFAIIFMASAIIFENIYLFNIIFLFLLVYFIVSILKNYRFIKNNSAFFYLPLLQIVSDAAVFSGMIKGIIVRRLML